jgi:hypothetical protein
MRKSYLAQAVKGFESVTAKLIPNKELVNTNREVIASMKRGAKFFIPKDGAVSTLEYSEIEPISLNLPFPEMVLEYEDWLFGPTVVNCILDSHGHLHLNSLIKVDGIWIIVPGTVSFVDAPNTKIGVKNVPGDLWQLCGDLHNSRFTPLGVSVPESDPQIRHITQQQIKMLVMFLTVMACSNVVAEEEVITRKQRMQATKNNTVCYTYHQLVVKASAKTTTALGGTHSSPREHLRRGHIRRLPTGSIWVNSCIVNAGSVRGRVDKDYLVA